eukprot:5755630-Prymnesium_polylepis.1
MGRCRPRGRRARAPALRTESQRASRGHRQHPRTSSCCRAPPWANLRKTAAPLHRLPSSSAHPPGASASLPDATCRRISLLPRASEHHTWRQSGSRHAALAAHRRVGKVVRAASRSGLPCMTTHPLPGCTHR